MRGTGMRMSALLRGGVIHTAELDAVVDERELEWLRRALRRELRVHPGQESLARLIGVSRIVIRKFIVMRTTPTPANLARIRDWAADRPEVYTPLGAVLLAVLAGELPAEQRMRSRREVAEVLAMAHQRVGRGVPEWLVEELGVGRECAADGYGPGTQRPGEG